MIPNSGLEVPNPPNPGTASAKNPQVGYRRSTSWIHAQLGIGSTQPAKSRRRQRQKPPSWVPQKHQLDTNTRPPAAVQQPKSLTQLGFGDSQLGIGSTQPAKSRPRQRQKPPSWVPQKHQLDTNTRPPAARQQPKSLTQLGFGDSQLGIGEPANPGAASAKNPQVGYRRSTSWIPTLVLQRPFSSRSRLPNLDSVIPNSGLEARQIQAPPAPKTPGWVPSKQQLDTNTQPPAAVQPAWMDQPRSSLRGVADRFDVVAIGVSDKCTEVIRVVLGPDPGLVKHLSS